jgi:hypothetical protein
MDEEYLVQHMNSLNLQNEFDHILRQFLLELSKNYYSITVGEEVDFRLDEIKIDNRMRYRLLEECFKNEFEKQLTTYIEEEYPGILIEESLIQQLINEMFLYLQDMYLINIYL